MKTLLVATDFSSAGNNALKFAAQFATDLKTNLVVFHAVHLPLFSPTISKADFLALEKRAEAEQHKRLDKLVSKIYRDQALRRMMNKVSVLVKNSVFAMDAILSAAKTSKADLIIVGTHGATGLKLFGSNTSELIFNSEIPVLAIPPRYRYRSIETIVYASDLKNLTNELRCIMPIAQRAKAVIEVLNFDLNGNEVEPRARMNGSLKDLKYKKIEVIARQVKQKATIVDQLKRYLKNRRPQILVLFPERRSLLDKIFVRSKTEALSYEVKLPLLTYLKSRVK